MFIAHQSECLDPPPRLRPWRSPPSAPGFLSGTLAGGRVTVQAVWISRVGLFCRAAALLPVDVTCHAQSHGAARPTSHPSGGG